LLKKRFKATCFGSKEPSSGLFIRADPYLLTSTFGIPNLLVNRYGSVLAKRPYDGRLEPKHVALNMYFNNKIVFV